MSEFVVEEVVDTTLSSEGVANVLAPHAEYVCWKWEWRGKGQSLGTRWMARLNRVPGHDQAHAQSEYDFSSHN